MISFAKISEYSVEMKTQYAQLNTPLSFNQIVEIVKQLPSYEKQQLGELIWAEQDMGNVVIPQTHKQIVRERVMKYEDSPSSYLSWDDIERKMATRK